MQSLPGQPGSCWLARAPQVEFPPLNGAAECDTVVIGAGIVGLTTALSLCEQGRSVVVLEARRVGRQVTGGSSAKITTQHGLCYQHLIGTFGLDLARAYADANVEAIDRIRAWIRSLAIDCDYETRPAYLYTVARELRDDLEREADAARQVGLDARMLDRAPLPFETAGALCFPEQAQFNPASYLIGLARAVQAAGGRVHEGSRAHTIGEGDRWRAVTDAGEVNARHMVVATNITVKSPVGYANRTLPRSHVAIAFRLRRHGTIEGMFLGVDQPTHSIRTGRDAEGELLLVLGPKFNTGQDGDVAARVRELEDWARSHLPVEEALWRWCNEDYDTADRMPYVGEPAPDSSPGYFVATGFNAWGISNGTAAGLMIASTIATGGHRWGKLYAPVRPYPDGFNKGGDTQSRVDSLDAVPPGGGGVVEVKGELIAASRGFDGTLTLLSASCTHKGCTVTWNNADRTWDCPCHGSMFEADGTVIHGPARQPLPRL
jgi:glycine/D-amino acid oxidase-like deaminating enzyme/nitrite reductase/ring-hydroxylating ferredoxin subunit